MSSSVGDNPLLLMTLLWLAINVSMVGYVFSSLFLSGGKIPLELCLVTQSPTPAPSVISNLSSPTISPNFNFTEDYGQAALETYDDGNAGFVVMWSVLLLIGLSIGGTQVLRNYRTPFAIGSFSGVVFVMANLMLMQAATSAGELRRRAKLGLSSGADSAILAFSMIEFLLLSAFFIVMVRNRQAILEMKPPESEQIADQSTIGI